MRISSLIENISRLHGYVIFQEGTHIHPDDLAFLIDGGARVIDLSVSLSDESL